MAADTSSPATPGQKRQASFVGVLAVAGRPTAATGPGLPALRLRMHPAIVPGAADAGVMYPAGRGSPWLRRSSERASHSRLLAQAPERINRMLPRASESSPSSFSGKGRQSHDGRLTSKMETCPALWTPAGEGSADLHRHAGPVTARSGDGPVRDAENRGLQSEKIRDESSPSSTEGAREARPRTRRRCPKTPADFHLAPGPKRQRTTVANAVSTGTQRGHEFSKQDNSASPRNQSR